MTIIRRGIVYSPTVKQPYSETYTNNFNHAPNLVNLGDGNCLAAWFSGPWEGHPFQKILMSRFDGEKWSEAKVLQNTEGVSDFDPAFIRSGNRIYFFYSNARWFVPQLHGKQRGALGTYYRWSDDEGCSWSEACLLSEKNLCKSNGCCLENGYLLLPVYNKAVNQVGVFKSTDEGENWELHESDPIDPRIVEPSIVELSENHIVIIARTKMGTLWKSESMDAGENWTPSKPTAIKSYNAPVSLIKNNSSLLICYNSGKTRGKLCLSSTGLLSFHWNSTLVIDQIKDSIFPRSDSIHGSGSDCAVTYPSMINYNDAKIMVAWSRYEINENEHKGEICYCIVEF